MKTITLQEAKELLQIDENHIDDIVKEYPAIYNEIAERFVEAKSLRDELKGKLKELWSREFLRIKKGNPRITDAIAKAEADIHPEYLEIQKDYFYLSKEADLWEKMLESWDRRAKMINNLCELIATGRIAFFSVKKSSTELYDTNKKEMRKEKEV